MGAGILAKPAADAIIFLDPDLISLDPDRIRGADGHTVKASSTGGQGLGDEPDIPVTLLSPSGKVLHIMESDTTAGTAEAELQQLVIEVVRHAEKHLFERDV